MDFGITGCQNNGMVPLSEQTSMLMNTNSGLNGRSRPDLSSLDMQKNTERKNERKEEEEE